MNKGTKHSSTAHAMVACEATVRFAHVDAAGVIFYPRYIEILADLYPELFLTSGPFTLELAFRRANRLGDRVQLTGEYDPTNRRWDIFLRYAGEQHFSAKLGLETSLPIDAHRAGEHAFRAETVTVGRWAVGGDNRLQLSRYLECVSSAVEQWCERTLDLPFRKLQQENNGVPTVKLDVRCRELPKLDDTFSIWIRPTRLTTHSISFTSWLVCGERCLLEARQVIVFVTTDNNVLTSGPLPDRLRVLLQQQMAVLD